MGSSSSTTMIRAFIPRLAAPVNILHHRPSAIFRRAIPRHFDRGQWSRVSADRECDGMPAFKRPFLARKPPRDRLRNADHQPRVDARGPPAPIRTPGRWARGSGGSEPAATDDLPQPCESTLRHQQHVSRRTSTRRKRSAADEHAVTGNQEARHASDCSDFAAMPPSVSCVAGGVALARTGNIVDTLDRRHR